MFEKHPVPFQKFKQWPLLPGLTPTSDYHPATKAYVDAAGKIKQVIGSSVISGSSTTSASAVDVTGASQSITPTSASSKILVIAVFLYSTPILLSTNVTMYHRILRDGGVIGQSFLSSGMDDGDGNNRAIGSHTFVFLDSPATVSAVTYKLQHWIGSGASSGTTSGVVFTLMEIGA